MLKALSSFTLIIGLISAASDALAQGESDASAIQVSLPLTFEKDVRPILKAHCFHCHGEDGEKEAGIDLRQVRLMRQTGAIDDTNHAASSILEQIRSGEMPKGGKPLGDDVANIIAQWLAQGAPVARPEPDEVPAYFITEEERNHWAFLPIVRPAVPPSGIDHPIDALIAKQMHEKELSFAPVADRVTLIRRASFDLIGIPPARDEVDAFVHDETEGAWERAIDRLLASPHYGERWGRHWLDVVGYADSNGGPKDAARSHAWQYRDYVVKAFNDDKPWSTMIQEQLAGDELARMSHENASDVLADPKTWDQVAATGFLRMAPDYSGDEPADARIAHESVIIDNLKVIGSSLLGLTVGCAQCHDHRFDPISHVDYHRLRALLEPTFNVQDWRTPSQRQYEAYTNEERAANAVVEQRAAEVDKARDDLIREEYQKYLEERLLAIKESTDESIRESIRAAWHIVPEKRSPEEKALLEKHDFTFWYAGHLRFLPNRGEQEARREAMVHEIDAIRETKLSRVMMVADEKRDVLPKTFRFHRGDYRQPKEEIGPGDLSIFDGPIVPSADPDQFSSGRRLAYARWLTSGKHPLVARVLVNRFWTQHFGRGLVTSLADFGVRTPRPVQSDLLDWLADEFMNNGWQLKRFHRLVMTSRAYMQQTHNAPSEAIDSDNVYLARMQLRRLEAEAVRDSLLQVCGNLKVDLGGKPILVARHPKGGVVLGRELSNPSNGVVHTVEPWGDVANRRSLYVQNLRNRPLTVLQTFDLPTMTPNCNQRAVTTVAPQSLMMLNDVFVIEQSRVLAVRLQTEHPNELSNQIESLWELAFGEQPSDSELASSLALVADEIPRQLDKGSSPKEASEKSLAALCQVIFASNRFLYAP
jgi:cytochrome c553